jgi:hypothetical protein
LVLALAQSCLIYQDGTRDPAAYAKVRGFGYFLGFFIIAVWCGLGGWNLFRPNLALKWCKHPFVCLFSTG